MPLDSIDQTSQGCIGPNDFSSAIEPVVLPVDIAELSQLAEVIWREHFTSIIGAPQVEYMLKTFQSAKAIESQLHEGMQYYFIVLNGSRVGYLALAEDTASRRLMISKIYVKRSCRGQSLGLKMLDFAERYARQRIISAIWLTVNRYNDTSIHWYLKQGFAIVDEIKKDIGSGFYMDDYILEKTLV